MIAYWLSFLTGLALLFTATYALVVFLKAQRLAQSDQSRRFGMGIILMALSLGTNTLYWQVLGQPFVFFEVITVGELRGAGFYADFALKGSGILGLIYAIKALKS